MPKHPPGTVAVLSLEQARWSWLSHSLLALYAGLPADEPLSGLVRGREASYAPEDVAGALQDRVHIELVKVRVPRVAKGRM